MAAVTFEFDGTDAMVAHITGATVGHTYFGYTTDPNFSQDTQVAAATTLDLSWSGIGGFTPTDLPFGAHVWDDTTKELVGTTIFAAGSTTPVPFSASWDYDAATGDVSVTFFAVAGIDYELDVFDRADFYSNTVTGAGAVLTLTATATSPFVGAFLGELSSTPPLPYPFYIDQSTRMFEQGVSGQGVMGNPSSVVVVTLDGVDVTQFCVAGNWTRRLNRPSTAQVRCPMELVNADVGTVLKIEALVSGSWKIVHHGRVLLCETDTAEDGGYTVYNSTDPMEMWQWRPVRADDGDFTKPAGSLETNGNDLFATYLTGSLIMQAVLKNTEGDSTAQGNPALTPPTDAEGPTFLDFGSFATGGADLSGAPTDFPMTIGELASLLVSTGELDLVITPTDPGGGIMGTVDGYNGRYGTDLSATIIFSYGMGDFNVRRLRWNQDMTNMVNKLWYYGGPRLHPAFDPAGDQHWCYNITGDDPAFNPGGSPQGAWAIATSYAAADTVTNTIGPDTYDFIALTSHGTTVVPHVSTADDEPGVGVNWRDYWTFLMVPPGGRNSPPASATDNQLGVSRISSQGSYGVRMDIQIFDALDQCGGVGAVGRDLYRKRWQQESWLRAVPREIIHITPTRETQIGTFDIGDLVGVEAVSAVRGGFSGAQRVYEYTVSWDADGVLELSELQTSADNEGL